MDHDGGIDRTSMAPALEHHMERVGRLAPGVPLQGTHAREAPARAHRVDNCGRGVGKRVPPDSHPENSLVVQAEVEHITIDAHRDQLAT